MRSSLRATRCLPVLPPPQLPAVNMRGKAFAAGLAATFGVLLALCGLQLRQAEIAARLSRTLVEAAPAMSPEWNVTPGHVLVAGDSRVVFWAPRPQIPGRNLFFAGLGGETTAGLRSRLARDLPLFAPDRLVLAAGINDLVAASLSPDRAEEVLDALAGNLAAIASDARAVGVQVTVLTIPRPARPGPARRVLLWSNDLPGLVEAANARIRAMEGPGIQVLDADAALAGVSGAPLPAALAADTVHFTPAAYTRLNALLAETFGG